MGDHVTRQVHRSDRGAGPALVLLHGLGGDAGFWTAEAPEWSKDSESSPSICAVRAPRPRRTAGTRSQTSMGGLVAQSVAARHPHRVRRLVLASTYAVMNVQARMFLDAVRDVVLADGSLRAVYPLVCPWLFSLRFLSDPANAAWLEAPEDDDEPPAGWLPQYRAQHDFDGRADLARITAPTLVLVGSDDRLVTVDDATVLADGVAAASIKIVAGAGHLINVEEHDRFVTEVREFLLGPGPGDSVSFSR